MFSRRFVLAATVSSMLLVAMSVQADVPRIMSYQGILTDNAGSPLTGVYTVTFAIYVTAEGGTALWSETLDVECEAGLFNVILGLTVSLDLDFSQQYWMGIQLAGDPPILPRMRMASVPYAYWAAIADTALGVKQVPGHDHDDLYYTESELHSPGTINDTTNPVDWTKLKSVPAGFADGVDDLGPGDGHSLDANDGNPIDVVYVDGAGRVGVGTTSPSSDLHVYDSSSDAILALDSGAGSKWEVQSASSGAFEIVDRDAGENRVIIHPSGKIGIGTVVEPPAETMLAVMGDIYCDGKLFSVGGVDPPYVLYDNESREAIIDRVDQEVPEDKLDGAVLFWNGDHLRFEIYLPERGEFRDLQGKLLDELE